MMWMLRLQNSIRHIENRLKQKGLAPHIRYQLQEKLERLKKELEELQS